MSRAAQELERAVRELRSKRSDTEEGENVMAKTEAQKAKDAEGARARRAAKAAKQAARAAKKAEKAAAPKVKKAKAEKPLLKHGLTHEVPPANTRWEIASADDITARGTRYVDVLFTSGFRLRIQPVNNWRVSDDTTAIRDLLLVWLKSLVSA